MGGEAVKALCVLRYICVLYVHMHMWYVSVCMYAYMCVYVCVSLCAYNLGRKRKGNGIEVGSSGDPLLGKRR